MERRLPDRPAISSFLAPRLVRVEGSKIAPMAWGQLSLRVSPKPLAPSTVHTVYAVLRSLMLSAWVSETQPGGAPALGTQPAGCTRSQLCPRTALAARYPGRARRCGRPPHLSTRSVIRVVPRLVPGRLAL